MNEILIVSCDRVFARMLFLELKRPDADLKVISGNFDLRNIMTSASKANIVVYDADYDGGDMAIVRQMNVPCVLFSKKKIEDLPENVVGFFARPFDVSKFVAFVQSHFKTVEKTEDEDAQLPQKNGLTLDRFSKRFMYEGEPISLSQREYSLLYLLYENRGKVVLRKDVLENVWGKDYDGKNNADNVYISYLRKKLDDAYGVKMIYTVRGKGYMLK